MRLLLFLVTFSLSLPGLRAAEPPASPSPSQFLAVLHLRPDYHADSAWTPAASGAVRQHFLRLQEAAKAGQVLFAGRTLEPNAQTMGLVVFVAENLEAAQTFMRDDPAVAAGVMDVTVRPYRLAIDGGTLRAAPSVTAVEP